MITVHGIANCDTCRKLRKWLDSAQIPHQFRDFRKDALTVEQVTVWIGDVGLDRLVNRRSATWRSLPDGQKACLDGGGAAAVLAANPTLLKRPVVEVGARRAIGFEAALAALRDRDPDLQA